MLSQVSIRGNVVDSQRWDVAERPRELVPELKGATFSLKRAGPGNRTFQPHITSKVPAQDCIVGVESSTWISR